MSISLTATAEPRDRALGADLLGALAQLPVPATVIYSTGKLVRQNRAGIEIFGDTLGRTLTRYIAEEDRARAVTAFVRVLEGTPVIESVMALGRGGRGVALTVIAAPLREQGRIAGALVIAFAAGHRLGLL